MDCLDCLVYWATPAFSKLHFVRFGDDFVVFESGSGGTHKIDFLAAFVLERVAVRPHSTQDIKDSILQRYDFLAETDLDTYLASLLDALSQKHLVRQIDA